MYKKHIPYLEVITIHHCQTVLIDPTRTIEFRKMIWLFRHKSAPFHGNTQVLYHGRGLSSIGLCSFSFENMVRDQSTRSNAFSCLFRAFRAPSGALPIMPIRVSRLKFCIMAHMGISGPILPPDILEKNSQASGFL